MVADDVKTYVTKRGETVHLITATIILKILSEQTQY